MRIKICGIRTPEVFDAAVAAGADYLGLVFFPPSPRAVTPAEAAALSARHQGGPLRVGLFVRPDDAAIEAALAAVPLGALQLHNVAPDRTQEIRAKFGLPVWSAVGVAGVGDLPRRVIGADKLLLDAKAPTGASRPGGNATSFDWAVLAGWRAPAPWMLAGGLTPDNVGAAIRITGASEVDVSSGVETAPGVKHPASIRAFIANARRAIPI